MEKADLFYKPLLREAWGLTKKNYWLILGFLVIYLLLSFGLKILQGDGSNIIILLISIVVSVLLKFWSTRFSIWIARGQEIKFASIFRGFGNFKEYFITNIILGLIVLGGFILLIVPGIIWSLKYFLAPYYSLEQGLKYKEALKASANATKGVRGKILLFWILFLLIILVSIIPVGLGLLATLPMAVVLYGLLYVRLSSQIVNQNTMPNPGMESMPEPAAMPEMPEPMASPNNPENM